MIGPHRLARPTVERLAEGLADPEALRQLRAGQLSKRLVLLRAIRDLARRTPAARAVDLDHCLSVLTTAHRARPDPVREVLLRPQVGAWAAHCLRRLHRVPGSAAPTEPAGPTSPTEPDGGLIGVLAYLGSVAAAAAAAAGVDCAVPVAVRQGAAVVPGAGRLPVTADAAAEVTHLRVAAGALGPTGPGAWQAPHDLSTGWGGLRLGLWLDDVDPFRACGLHRVAGRLPDPDVERWRGVVAAAWRVLVEVAPDRARAVAGVLRVAVPLTTPPGGAGMSVTSRDGVGAFALTEPPGALSLAQTLVHESQHSTLSALLDLVPLVDPDRGGGPAVHYAPWRADPRPLDGLLQGAYAFLGVAGLWAALRGTAYDDGGAEYETVRVAEQVRTALGAAAGDALLTAEGRWFVAAMQRAVARLLREPCDPAAARRARQANEALRAAWVGRHGART